jgi:hypothetical protein
MIADVIRNLDLNIDEQYRGDCPICSGYNTFTAIRTVNGVLFNCYKADCKLSGKRPMSVRVRDMQAAQIKESTKPFRLPTQVLLGRPELTEWIEYHTYPFKALELYYDVKEDRVVFPIRHRGLLVDATGRSRDIGIRRFPKWKRYGSASYAYTSGNGRIAVVVEDAISAAVIGATDNNSTGVALLGTFLLTAHVEQLQGYTGVIVALDPDAANKTLEFTRELRGLMPNIRVKALKLEDDLKYRRKNDIVNVQECIRSAIWN